MKIRIVSIFVLLFFVSTPLFVYGQQAGQIRQATEDAKRDAKQYTSTLAWGAGGFVCSGFAVLFAVISKPEVPVHKLIGKSPVYVSTYTRVYKRQVKRIRTRSTVIGCGVAAGVSAIASLFVQDN